MWDAPVLAPTPSGRNDNWFCIATNWGQDALAEAALTADHWRVYRPLHLRRRDRKIEPLFPGYLFVALDLHDSDWPRVCRARGVYRILGRPGHPQPLPTGVIENLIARTSARRVVDDPGQDASVVYLHPGDHAHVLSGPLAGFSGICTVSRETRIRLLLNLFGRPSEVEFSPQAVAPL